MKHVYVINRVRSMPYGVVRVEVHREVPEGYYYFDSAGRYCSVNKVEAFESIKAAHKAMLAEAADEIRNAKKVVTEAGQRWKGLDRLGPEGLHIRIEDPLVKELKR